MTNRSDVAQSPLLFTLRKQASRCLEVMAYKLVEILAKMPLAQGVIVFMALSLAMGTLAYSNIEIIATLTSGVAFFVVMSIGSLTLWLLRHDRRKHRNFVELAIMLLMLTNLLYLFDITPLMRGFLYDVASSVIILALFFSVAHDVYMTHPSLEEFERGLHHNE